MTLEDIRAIADSQREHGQVTTVLLISDLEKLLAAVEAAIQVYNKYNAHYNDTEEYALRDEIVCLEGTLLALDNRGESNV